MSFFESLRIFFFFFFLAWEFWGWQHKILIMSIKRQWSKSSTWFNINKFIVDEFIKWLRNKGNSFRISKENGISNLFPCPGNTTPGNYTYSYLRDKSLSLYPPSYVSDALEISLYTQEAYTPTPGCVLFPMMLWGCLCSKRPTTAEAEETLLLGKVDSQILPGWGF